MDAQLQFPYMLQAIAGVPRPEELLVPPAQGFAGAEDYEFEGCHGVEDWEDFVVQLAGGEEDVGGAGAVGGKLEGSGEGFDLQGAAAGVGVDVFVDGQAEFGGKGEEGAMVRVWEGGGHGGGSPGV